MTHYFSKNQDPLKHDEKQISYTFEQETFTFTTDSGVFSKDHVDDATDLLLNNITIQPQEDVLDLGCGYGVIGTVVSKRFEANLTMIDVNLRALDLTRKNLNFNNASATVFESDGFSNVNQVFDHIVTNPPIRIGKKQLYTIFENAKAHLKFKGLLWIVMHKKHGALSAIKFLKHHYQVSVLTKQKGFHVIQCQNSLTI